MPWVMPLIAWHPYFPLTNVCINEDSDLTQTNQAERGDWAFKKNVSD